MVRGEYWWLDCRESGIRWSRRMPGITDPVAEGYCADVSELPAPVGASLVVSIPGEQVRIHRVNLPKHNRRKFLASLGYVLEDRLLHAPENYHLAAYPTDVADSDLPVAVVARSYLGPLLASLQQKDWRLLMICPDYCFIENSREHTWALDLVESPMLLRFAGAAGGAVISGTPSRQPPGALLLALEQASVLPQKLILITADTSVRGKVEAWRDVLGPRGIEIEIIGDEGPRFGRLARSPLPAQGFNLLTGSYAIRPRYAREVKRLLPLAVLTALLLMVWALQWFTSGSQLRQEHGRLQSAIEQTYRELFPRARNLVDPRFQMEQELQALQRAAPAESGTPPGFLQRLEQIADASDGLDARLIEMRYDDNGMTIELSTPDYQVLEDLQLRLRNFMEVTVEDAELRDERVYSQIRLGGDA